jgi:hypothetical protein
MCLDGVELGLMPVASLSVSQSLLGDAYTPTPGGDWSAFTRIARWGRVGQTASHAPHPLQRSRTMFGSLAKPPSALRIVIA